MRCDCSICATYSLRGLCRLLPLPCAKRTSAWASLGRASVPSSVTRSTSMKTSRLSPSNSNFRPGIMFELLSALVRRRETNGHIPLDTFHMMTFASEWQAHDDWSCGNCLRENVLRHCGHAIPFVSLHDATHTVALMRRRLALFAASLPLFSREVPA